MLTKIKEILRWAITGSFALIIAACYGPPMGVRAYQVGVSTTDKKGEPITGLRVSLLTNNAPYQVRYSDLKGYTGFLLPNSFEGDMKLLIEDSDGAENGGEYKTTTLTNIKSGDNKIQAEMQNK